MRTLNEEANAKIRANIFAKNDALEGVGVEMVRVEFPPKHGVTPKLPSEVAQCL